MTSTSSAWANPHISFVIIDLVFIPLCSFLLVVRQVAWTGEPLALMHFFPLYLVFVVLPPTSFDI
jgi:hypothetical protein